MCVFMCALGVPALSEGLCLGKNFCGNTKPHDPSPVLVCVRAILCDDDLILEEWALFFSTPQVELL